MPVTVREGDTHDVSWQVMADGAPMDLDGMTAVVHVQLPKGSPINLAAIVETVPESEPEQWRIRHTLTGTLAAGTYLLEIELTKDGVKATAPTAKNDTLTVVKQIA